MRDNEADALQALHFVLREETSDDVVPIEEVTCAAFRDHPFSRQTEHLIVRGLREAGALQLSLVATADGRVVGHLACSPVRIGDEGSDWCGLGPVSVTPALQRSGIGSALIRSALRRLSDRQVAGCVVLGDPAYYTRFGFAPQAGLTLPGPPASHFMALALAPGAAPPTGEVSYHRAFGA